AAIELNDQVGGSTVEVDDVSSHRHLPPELEADEATIAQETPELPFDLGRPTSHGSGKCPQTWSPIRPPVGPRGLARLIPFGEGGKQPLIRPSGTFSLKGRRG